MENKQLIKSNNNKVIEKKQSEELIQKVEKKKKLKFQQRMLVRYIVAGLPVEDASTKVRASVSRCKNWLKDERVMKYLEEQLQSKIDLDAKKRKRRMEFVSSELYDALLSKIADGSFHKMGSKNLMKFMLDFNKEIRTDTPGESNKKIDHKVTLEISDELQQRYKNANSVNFDTKDDKIIDITLPTQQEMKQVTDGAKNKTKT